MAPKWKTGVWLLAGASAVLIPLATAQVVPTHAGLPDDPRFNRHGCTFVDENGIVVGNWDGFGLEAFLFCEVNSGPPSLASGQSSAADEECLWFRMLDYNEHAKDDSRYPGDTWGPDKRSCCEDPCPPAPPPCNAGVIVYNVPSWIANEISSVDYGPSCYKTELFDDINGEGASLDCRQDGTSGHTCTNLAGDNFNDITESVRPYT